MGGRKSSVKSEEPSVTEQQVPDSPPADPSADGPTGLKLLAITLGLCLTLFLVGLVKDPVTSLSPLLLTWTACRITSSYPRPYHESLTSSIPSTISAGTGVPICSRRAHFSSPSGNCIRSSPSRLPTLSQSSSLKLDQRYVVQLHSPPSSSSEEPSLASAARGFWPEPLPLSPSSCRCPRDLLTQDLSAGSTRLPQWLDHSLEVPSQTK